ncbi:hypothetical protein [Paenibacillus bovis]|uniref:Uncharacterized protein n=1 Tax=Paenibacillus bovis TaxID=1616788 RepID=A0A172ZJS9_9BACL|nr:hypothetical protein [Paenibacillus bovis]ANF97662.1 hypothetical protein AR543_17700 [Paenibacillus bovis]
MDEKAYAYIDRTAEQVFHVLDNYEMAQKEAKGTVIEYRGEHAGGYPVVNQRQLIIYAGRRIEKENQPIPPYIQAAIDALS